MRAIQLKNGRLSPRVDFIIGNPKHHLAMFRPVCEWLQQRELCRIRVLSLCELRGFSTPVAELLEMGVTYKSIMPIRLSKESIPRQALKRRKTHGRLRNILQRVVWHSLIRYSPEKGEERPALVVLPNDTAYPYDLIARALRVRGIPFLLMQEGIRFELPSTSTNGKQYGQAGATAVSAWGMESARYFKQVGVPATRIHAVGNPRLDELRNSDWSDPARILARELQLGSNVLLYVSNPIDQQGFCATSAKYAAFVDFLRSAKGFLGETGYQLLVKIHTGESLEEYQALLAQEPVRGQVVLVRDAPMYPLFDLAKAVVVLASTAGLEAMIMDRPLGVLPVPGYGYIYDFVKDGAASALIIDEHLGEQLASLVNDSDDMKVRRRRYLTNQVANLGCATESNGRLIMKLLESTV